MKPVRILASPEKTRVAGAEIRRFRVRAMKMGKKVPTSPNEPEISSGVWCRKVERLWACVDLRWVRVDW